MDIFVRGGKCTKLIFAMRVGVNATSRQQPTWRWYSDFPSLQIKLSVSMKMTGRALEILCISLGSNRCATVCISADERIQFSSPPLFLGGPGMFSSTSCAPWDFLTTTSFSLTAVCILLTLVWSLWKKIWFSYLAPELKLQFLELQTCV